MMRRIYCSCLTVFFVLFLSIGRDASLRAQPVVPPSAKHYRILVLNGPNIDILGKRQPEIYGYVTLPQIMERMTKLAWTLNAELIFVQSNSEGALIDALHAHWDDVEGVIINPSGYSQRSVALHDAIEAVPFPVFEVHLSNIAARDALHQVDIIMPVCKSSAIGFGWRGHLLALEGLVGYLEDGNKN